MNSNDFVLELILHSGNLVYDAYFKKDYTITEKSKYNYVTSIDIEVSRFLDKKLSNQFSDVFFLSEEKDIHFQNRPKKAWILDPIDGTSEFINQGKELAISLGFVEDNKAVSGYVFNPITGELFFRQKQKVFYDNLKYPFSIKNVQPFQLEQAKNKIDTWNLFVSRNETKKRFFEDSFWKENFQITAKSSIAYKLGLLAVGKCDLIVSFNPKQEWDICAGIALLNSDENYIALELDTDKKFLFNQENIQTKGLIAGKTELVQTHYSKIKSLYLENQQPKS